MTEPTAEQPQVTATVSPAEPPRSRWGAIPRRLGRARTSTVVLSVLFLAIGALWINVRPTPNAPAGTTGVEQPVTPAPPAVPTPTEPATEPELEPGPTTEPESTTSSEPPATSSPDVPTTPETSARIPTTTTGPSVPAPDTATTPTG